MVSEDYKETDQFTTENAAEEEAPEIPSSEELEDELKSEGLEIEPGEEVAVDLLGGTEQEAADDLR